MQPAGVRPEFASAVRRLGDACSVHFSAASSRPLRSLLQRLCFLATAIQLNEKDTNAFAEVHQATALVREVANRIRRLDREQPTLRPASTSEVLFIIQSAQVYLKYTPNPAVVVLLADLVMNTSDGKRFIRECLNDHPLRVPR